MAALEGCPGLGLELSVVTRAAMTDWLPAPAFELHVNTVDRPPRIVDGHGRDGDPDLVLHGAAVLAGGRALLGPPASELIVAPPAALVEAQVRAELLWALDHASPAYQVLNACRAWRYLVEGVLCSKLEGAAWAHSHTDRPALIDSALAFQLGYSDVQPAPVEAETFVRSTLARRSLG